MNHTALEITTDMACSNRPLSKNARTRQASIILGYFYKFTQPMTRHFDNFYSTKRS